MLVAAKDLRSEESTDSKCEIEALFPKERATPAQRNQLVEHGSQWLVLNWAACLLHLSTSFGFLGTNCSFRQSEISLKYLSSVNFMYKERFGFKSIWKLENLTQSTDFLQVLTNIMFLIFESPDHGLQFVDISGTHGCKLDQLSLCLRIWSTE